MNKESIKAGYDTSDSFYSSAEFNYHHKKGDYQCRIILDNRQRAIDALVVNTNITKQQIEELINYIQKDNDVMISQLLTEATKLRQKLRTQKASLETVIRQLKSKVRSLSEENIQMTAELQMKQRIHKQEINELRKNKKQDRAEISYIDQEIEGMQRLLSEYQNQLQKKEKQNVYMKELLDEKSAFCQHAKIQIIKQTTEIEQLKQQIHYLEREQQTQKMIKSTHQTSQIQSLLHKERVLQSEVSDREFLIRCLNQEGVRKDKEIDNLKEIVAKLRNDLENQKNSKAVEKNKQNSNILKLQNASEAAIKSIKAKYNLKLQKIVQMVSRQLKKMRSQLEVIKTSAVKQMQLCFKQNKAIIKNQLKNLYSN